MTQNKKESLKNLIKAGNYDFVNDNINDKNFPNFQDMPSGKVELLHFDRYITSEEAIKEMESKGMRPANLKELLVFGKEYPEEQRKYPIVALGSVWRSLLGDRSVAVLWGDVSGRHLYLYWFDCGGGAFDRFAGVRQVASDTLTLGKENNLEKRVANLEEVVDKLRKFLI